MSRVPLCHGGIKHRLELLCHGGTKYILGALCRHNRNLWKNFLCRRKRITGEKGIKQQKYFIVFSDDSR